MYSIGVAAARALDSCSGIDPVAFIPSDCWSGSRRRARHHSFCHRGGIHWRSDVSDPLAIKGDAAQRESLCTSRTLAALGAGDGYVTYAPGRWLESTCDQLETLRVKDFLKWSPPLARCAASGIRAANPGVRVVQIPNLGLRTIPPIEHGC